MKETYVGKGRGRLEGMDKATGRRCMPGIMRCRECFMLRLSGRRLRMDIFIQWILAACREDVLVFTAEDLENNLIKDVCCDSPVFAASKVRYHLEPVALVAADSEKAAREAAKQVTFECEKLPVIETVEEALAEDAVKIHDSGNLIVGFENEKGSVAEGFKESDVIVEDTFELPVQDHGYMEPEAAFAYVDDDGRLHVYTSTQNVYNDRVMICHALGLPEERVHVKAATVGGGFGGKDGHTTQIFAALVAWKTGRPSKVVFDRTESLAASYKRHAAKVHVKIGCKKGWITDSL